MKLVDPNKLWKEFEDATPITDRVRNAILGLFNEIHEHPNDAYEDSEIGKCLLSAKVTASLNASDAEHYSDFWSLICMGVISWDGEVRVQLTDFVYRLAELCNALIEAERTKEP